MSRDSLETAIPGISRTVQVNRLRLHYLDFDVEHAATLSPSDDPRPTLIFIHGGAAHAHWFDFVARAFVTHYRVLSLDLRGHGNSEWARDSDYRYETYANDVAQFIQALKLEEAALVGHSMGGMVSLVTASRHPRWVRRLVVIDSMMQMTPQRASTLRGIGEGRGRAFESQDAYVRGFKIRPAGTTARPEIVRHMATHACRQFEDGQWRNKFDRNVYAKRHPIDGFAHWANVKAPALLVAGGDSDRITPEVLAKVRSACPQVENCAVEAAGHHVTLDNPTGFRREVGRILNP
ncbi:MAG: alpha/beta hydrolase [Pseudomonadota bacterium]